MGILKNMIPKLSARLKTLSWTTIS